MCLLPEGQGNCCRVNYLFSLDPCVEDAGSGIPREKWGGWDRASSPGIVVRPSWAPGGNVMQFQVVLRSPVCTLGVLMRNELHGSCWEAMRTQSWLGQSVVGPCGLFFCGRWGTNPILWWNDWREILVRKPFSLLLWVFPWHGVIKPLDL